LREDRFRPPEARFRPPPLRRGTLAPFFRASERPIAIACLRLLTRPPLPPGPLRSVPFFRRRIALSTRLLAARPYFRRPPDFFLAAMGISSEYDALGRCNQRAARECGQETPHINVTRTTVPANFES
jgi:hypothetical protein